MPMYSSYVLLQHNKMHTFILSCLLALRPGGVVEHAVGSKHAS